MGTSASYKGPNWPTSSAAVNDAAAAGAPTIISVGRAVSAFARDSLAHERARGGGNAQGGGAGSGGGGGARGRAASAGARLAGFLSTVQQNSLEEALKRFDLGEYRDKSLEEICDGLVEALTEPDGLLEDNALREAMDRTLEELSKNAQTADDLEKILTSKEINITEVVAIYYCHVLIVNFEVKEFHRIRERVTDNQQSRAFLDRARDYIRGFVEYRLSKELDLTKYDLNGPAASEMAANLNRDVIEALGNDV